MLLVTKLANLTDVASLIEDIIKAKDYFFTSDNDDLQELILEEEDFPEIEVEIPSVLRAHQAQIRSLKTINIYTLL